MLLVRGFVVAIAGGDHHSFDTKGHHLVEEIADAFGVGAVEESGIGGDTEAAFDRFADCFGGDVVGAFTADGKIVVIFLAVHVDAEGEIFTGGEEVELFFQQQCIGAEIDLFLSGDQALDDFVNLRVHQRLAAGDRNHGGAAFVDGFETLLGGQVLFQHVGGVLDLPATCAGEIAAKEGLEHEHERVLLVAAQALLEHIRGDGPHLGNWYAHKQTFDLYGEPE
jgi:hypothetical protein